jgi:sucrose-6-phosphate hydrolase SacC (GH32 family)
VDSFGSGDSDQGTLLSPEFQVDADQISFLIGGGSHPGKTGIRLLVGGQEVRTATGNNSPQLEQKTWDVSEFRGKSAQLEIFDNYSDGDWGHVFVDHIMLGGKSAPARAENALWVDYGRDFYAATSWSNIPTRDGRRIALGWMSNWEYAQDAPTTPWRNAMTVPRVLSLTQTPDGPRLVQEPKGTAKAPAGPSLEIFGRQLCRGGGLVG